jgi:amidophosphoribosyltransferase
VRLWHRLPGPNQSIDEIRRYLNADSLGYLSIEGMVAATGQPRDSFCLACYDGNYPVPFDPYLDKQIIENRKRRTQGLSSELDGDQGRIQFP